MSDSYHRSNRRSPSGNHFDPPPRFCSRKRTCFLTVATSASTHRRTLLPQQLLSSARPPGPRHDPSTTFRSSFPPPSLLPVSPHFAISEILARTDWIIFHHAQRPMRPRPAQGAVVARQGHGDEADGYCSGFRCLRGGLLARVLIKEG